MPVRVGFPLVLGQHIKHATNVLDLCSGILTFEGRQVVGVLKVVRV